MIIAMALSDRAKQYFSTRLIVGLGTSLLKKRISFPSRGRILSRLR
jgi:hypothetical protein